MSSETYSLMLLWAVLTGLLFIGNVICAVMGGTGDVSTLEFVALAWMMAAIGAFPWYYVTVGHRKERA